MSTPRATFAGRIICGRAVRSWYVEHRPPAAGADLVSCGWSAAPGWSRPLRLLPDGCVDVSWDGCRLRVTPARAAPTTVEVSDRPVTAGIRLHPHAAVAVFGRPMPQLDAPMRLDELWPPSVVEVLLAALTTCASSPAPDDAIAILTAAVVERSTELSNRPDPSVAHAIRCLDEPGPTVGGVAAALGVSERTMHRRVLGDVGLAPKQMHEILRFRRAFDAFGSADLATVAVTAGYYDQSHLARWCGRLAGTTPARLAAGCHVRRR
ncbi:helix-turn-helix domain-containing protein [Desertimonas flava]|uniref:helix-turn-helix domain-containing protein n=1 Tax=Desertimonas flava TaxID=2064846 RepID=UPI0013C526D6|nr:helix-turn-helix domain-containing protein [Desertimonas flava]